MSKERQRKIIFLDMDGVLCTSRSHVANRGKGLMQHLDVTAVKLLSVLLEKTSAELVLSSTWREHHDKTSMTAILQNAGMSVVPWHQNWKTPVDERTGFRGNEIASWLRHSGGDCKYLIIDDSSDFLPEQLPFFVHTTFDDGFLFSHYSKAMEILK